MNYFKRFSMTVICLSLFFSPIIASYASMCPIPKFNFKKGDLLFSDIACGSFCDAIDHVTKRKDLKSINHVGIVVRFDSSHQPVIMEAVSKGVSRISLSRFLNRSRKDSHGCPDVFVARVRKPYNALIPAAIQWVNKQQGDPYNDTFSINKYKSYYCSQLVYEAFRQANHGQPIFKLIPMTFKDLSTGKTLPAWKQYFKLLQAQIPEGLPGISPVSLSEEKDLKIIYWYGDFTHLEHSKTNF